MCVCVYIRVQNQIPIQPSNGPKLQILRKNTTKNRLGIALPLHLHIQLHVYTKIQRMFSQMYVYVYIVYIIRFQSSHTTDQNFKSCETEKNISQVRGCPSYHLGVQVPVDRYMYTFILCPELDSSRATRQIKTANPDKKAMFLGAQVPVYIDIDINLHEYIRMCIYPCPESDSSPATQQTKTSNPKEKKEAKSQGLPFLPPMHQHIDVCIC